MDGNTLGIDFGTSFCTMCRCNPETGKPEVIRDECGLDKIPSAVYWGPGGDVRVGDAAVAVLQSSLAMAPEKGREARDRVIASVKRRFYPDRMIALPGGETVSPVDVAAAILKYLKRNAEELCFHGPVRSATLTHPASFTRAQKALLEEAGRKAGFESVRLLEEPVAAAMGYAVSGAGVGKGILVYDLGGGTLDLAFVARDGADGFRVPVASCGDASCGGDDFDRALYDYAEADLLKTQGVRFSEEGIDLSFLLACRQVKERLSHAESGVVRHFLDGRNAAYTLSMDRKTFEGLVAPKVAHTAALAEELMRRVREAKFEVDTVVLIGGSSRIPLVRESLGKAIRPIKPLATMHADFAVAMGAAAQLNVKCEVGTKQKSEFVDGKSIETAKAVKINMSNADRLNLQGKLAKVCGKYCEELEKNLVLLAVQGTELFQEKISGKGIWSQQERIKYLNVRERRAEFVREYLGALLGLSEDLKKQLDVQNIRLSPKPQQQDFTNCRDYLGRKIVFRQTRNKALWLDHGYSWPVFILGIPLLLSLCFMIWVTNRNNEGVALVIWPLLFGGAWGLSSLVAKLDDSKRIFRSIRADVDSYFDKYVRIFKTDFEKYIRLAEGANVGKEE